jgi:membrane associated rhomboid family serine protease
MKTLLTSDILKKLKQSDNLDILIGLNIILFLISQVLLAFDWFSLRWVALSPQIEQLFSHPWTIITYGFFHQGFIALFFNLLLLFYFGSILLDFASQKKLTQLYFWGVPAGGIFFLASYRFFPDMYIIDSPLLGASAGVMSVMTYISLLMPHYQIKIRFLGFFKLIHILIFFIVFNLLQIPLGNPGGYFAHLGGLTAGFIIFVISEKQLFNKKNNTDNFLISKEKRIDDILDKISRSGYESLTQNEKNELFKQSKNK